MLKFQTGTKGESIFDALDEFLKEKETPLSNILSVATDAAPALLLMIGRALRVFSRIFNRAEPNLLYVHIGHYIMSFK